MRDPFWTRRLIGRLSVNALSLFAVAFCAPLFAANPDSQKHAKARADAAEALLEEALSCEIYGLRQERSELLAKAEALAPDNPAIKWQRGMILADGRWTPAEEVAVASASDSLLSEYVAKRDASADTLAGNLLLARWCQDNKLLDQERAHLERALKYEPDHAKARLRLGYVRIGDEWMSREDISRALAEEARAQASISKNSAVLRALIEELTDENAAVRERTYLKIQSIRDVGLIPALERLVAGISEEASFAVLNALTSMPEKEATMSLARFAVLSPSLRTRGEASERLKERDFDQFVPAMIASMRSPVQASYAFERRMDARLVYRETFYREMPRSTKVAVNDLVYANSQPSVFFNRNGTVFSFGRSGDLRGGNDRDDRAVADAAENDATFRRAIAKCRVAFENAEASDLNARLADALTAATGEQLGTDSQTWWNWWDQYNGLAQTGPKQVDFQYSQSFQSVGKEKFPERERITDIRQPQDISCFAAGTLVLTNRGDVAIEQVRAGDLVVAQDVETGEIAFKPVLETTVRPPAELLRVEHEQGSFRCTGGHPFWVSGEGWVHAKRLTSGVELHSLHGSVRVSDVVSDGSEETYNLIVADFANYFVDEARILSHDNSSRRATDAIVPGLQQE